MGGTSRDNRGQMKILGAGFLIKGGGGGGDTGLEEHNYFQGVPT